MPRGRRTRGRPAPAAHRTGRSTSGSAWRGSGPAPRRRSPSAAAAARAWPPSRRAAARAPRAAAPPRRDAAAGPAPAVAATPRAARSRPCSGAAPRHAATPEARRPAPPPPSPRPHLGEFRFLLPSRALRRDPQEAIIKSGGLVGSRRATRSRRGALENDLSASPAPTVVCTHTAKRNKIPRLPVQASQNSGKRCVKNVNRVLNLKWDTNNNPCARGRHYTRYFPPIELPAAALQAAGRSFSMSSEAAFNAAQLLPRRRAPRTAQAAAAAAAARPRPRARRRPSCGVLLALHARAALPCPRRSRR